MPVYLQSQFERFCSWILKPFSICYSVVETNQQTKG
jgi:hypothetical protein